VSKHERMTQTLPSGPRADTVTIRPYRPVDHNACRNLWAELTAEHQGLYEARAVDVGGGAADLGAGFEEYLTRLDLSGMWVAQHPDLGVVAFAGLILLGRSGAVDPVVVTEELRGRGIGRLLLEHVAEQARKRGMRQLSISPAIRNIGAIHCMYRSGYDTAATVTLTLDLTGQQRHTGEGVDLHGVRFFS
jgi:GNAT superfamily N-acetyltransferase